MTNNNANDEIVIGINKSASKTKINADLKKILSQINDLEADISIDPQQKTKDSGNTLDTMGKSAEATGNSINTLSNTWSKFINLLINSDQSVSGIATFKNIVEGVKLLTSSYKELGAVAMAVPLFIGNQKIGGGLIRLVTTTDNSPFLATVECNSDVYDSYILL